VSCCVANKTWELLENEFPTLKNMSEKEKVEFVLKKIFALDKKVAEQETELKKMKQGVMKKIDR